MSPPWANTFGVSVTPEQTASQPIPAVEKLKPTLVEHVGRRPLSWVRAGTHAQADAGLVVKQDVSSATCDHQAGPHTGRG